MLFCFIKIFIVNILIEVKIFLFLFSARVVYFQNQKFYYTLHYPTIKTNKKSEKKPKNIIIMIIITVHNCL